MKFALRMTNEGVPYITPSSNGHGFSQVRRWAMDYCRRRIRHWRTQLKIIEAKRKSHYTTRGN